MNYEELLAAKNGGKLNLTQLPIGEYYRMQQDGKYRGRVDIRPQLQGNILFTEGLKQECERNKTLANGHQLHFDPIVENGEITALEIELGTFQSFQQLLLDTPAVVAGKDFAENVLEQLVNITEYLHQQGIRHLCYSPSTVLARKGDNSVMLLSHGSFYQQMSDLQGFFGDDAKYVAPEVLNHGTVDDRCDVYSIGRFMEELFSVASLPLEFRRAVKKAVSEAPEDRFETPTDMLKSIRKRKDVVRTTTTLLVALAIALIAVWVYFDWFPETNPVEFVKPAPRTPTDDLLDDGFDPAELGVTSQGDSLVYDEAAERDYQATSC